MTDKERYLKIKDGRDSLASKLSAFPREIETLGAEIAPLEEEVLKLEILGDSSAAAKRAEIREKTAHIRQLESEREEAKRRLEVSGKVLVELREKAEKELYPGQAKMLKRAIEVFLAKIQEAFAAEIELSAAREEVKRVFQEIDSGNFPTVSWNPIFLRGPWDKQMKGAVESILAELQAGLQILK